MKPILFNTKMVMAIKDDRKTATRRLIKPQPVLDGRFWELGGAMWADTISTLQPMPAHSLWNRMPYKPGDILYVRETFFEFQGRYYYKADRKHLSLNALLGSKEFFKWRPSIHMPKEAARLFLRVMAVRVEQLKDITEDRALSEGFSSRAEFISEFLKMYPACTEESWLWVFELKRISKEESLKNGV